MLTQETGCDRHAHSDHYTNLSYHWKSGPIYCSQGTANLIIHMLRVDPKWVVPLPMDVETEVPGTGGVRVTLIEANHCTFFFLLPCPLLSRLPPKWWFRLQLCTQRLP